MLARRSFSIRCSGDFERRAGGGLIFPAFLTTSRSSSATMLHYLWRFLIIHASQVFGRADGFGLGRESKGPRPNFVITRALVRLPVGRKRWLSVGADGEREGNPGQFVMELMHPVRLADSSVPRQWVSAALRQRISLSRTGQTRDSPAMEGYLLFRSRLSPPWNAMQKVSANSTRHSS
jgi:hypothetical protein